jgi:hypothetical protein
LHLEQEATPRSGHPSDCPLQAGGHLAQHDLKAKEDNQLQENAVTPFKIFAISNLLRLALAAFSRLEGDQLGLGIKARATVVGCVT